ncbi:MAG: DUF4320 family protein [Lachnospiraceae bacterium]|nr:DUF4320 family protein [Lachnospiraceae bacterium]
MLNTLKSKRGEGYVDVVVTVLVIMLFVALAVKVFPVFIMKNQLDTFADEIVREFEIIGRVGSETTSRANQLKTQIGISPNISWSRIGNVQLNQEATVTLTLSYDIGFFNFGSFPITLTSKATGKSEVYWK